MNETNILSLKDKKKELEERLEKIKNDIKGGLDADLKEQAIQLENRDVLLEIARVTEEELQKINASLQNAG
jgi:RNA polymerase-binding transcription factor DksA